MAEVLTELCEMILPFHTIQKELKRKKNSLLAHSRKNFDDFTNFFENERFKHLKPEMLFILNILQSVESNSKDHPSLAAYCEHPFRVTIFCMNAVSSPSKVLMSTALMHNIYELSGLNEYYLTSKGVSSEVADNIRLLTINREFESDKLYLKDFYGHIEASSEELTLIRCIDKLDNLMACQLIRDQKYRCEYIELAEEFVQPMAERLDASFGSFFQKICDHAKESDFDEILSNVVSAKVQNTGDWNDW